MRGVVAGWTFDDGKVTDSVGEVHGELFKAAKIVDKGRFGKALDVDGSKDTRADIEFTPALEKVIEDAHTVGYWLLTSEQLPTIRVFGKAKKSVGVQTSPFGW